MQSQVQPATQQFRVGNAGLMTSVRSTAARDAVLEQVVALGRARVVTEGTAIHRAGDPFRSIFFVKSGAAKRMLIQEDGREQILGFPMPGDIVGMEAIDAGVHTTTVIALDLCAVVEIPFEAIEALAAENPAVARFMYHRMSAALRDPFKDEGWTDAFRDLLAQLTNTPSFARLSDDLKEMQGEVRAAAAHWYAKARML